MSSGKGPPKVIEPIKSTDVQSRITSSSVTQEVPSTTVNPSLTNNYGSPVLTPGNTPENVSASAFSQMSRSGSSQKNGLDASIPAKQDSKLYDIVDEELSAPGKRVNLAAALRQLAESTGKTEGKTTLPPMKRDSHRPGEAGQQGIQKATKETGKMSTHLTKTQTTTKVRHSLAPSESKLGEQKVTTAFESFFVSSILSCAQCIPSSAYRMGTILLAAVNAVVGLIAFILYLINVLDHCKRCFEIHEDFPSNNHSMRELSYILAPYIHSGHMGIFILDAVFAFIHCCTSVLYILTLLWLDHRYGLYRLGFVGSGTLWMTACLFTIILGLGWAGDLVDSIQAQGLWLPSLVWCCILIPSVMFFTCSVILDKSTETPN